MRPLVSVITLTYNQVSYLRKCLDGVRMQEGEFELEHIIVDDASSDGTAELLAAYDGHPIRVIRHASNTGANQGMVEAYAEANGEFVATCEGDDWWMAPDKIQAQIELMRRRPDLAMCFHDAVVSHESKLQWPAVRPGAGDPVQTLDQLLVDNMAHTCTVLYRRIADLEYPDWYTHFTVGDWPNHAFHAAHGPIGYINRPLAAYRVHDKGSWSPLDAKMRSDQICEMLQELDAHFLFRYEERIASTVERIRADAAESVGV